MKSNRTMSGKVDINVYSSKLFSWKTQPEDHDRGDQYRTVATTEASTLGLKPGVPLPNAFIIESRKTYKQRVFVAHIHFESYAEYFDETAKIRCFIYNT